MWYLAGTAMAEETEFRNTVRTATPSEFARLIVCANVADIAEPNLVGDKTLRADHLVVRTAGTIKDIRCRKKERARREAAQLHELEIWWSGGQGGEMSPGRDLSTPAT